MVNRKINKRLQGFTLVELLVVIAIISVLAGMLMPALEQAMDQANTISCMSNQKQIIIAVMDYAYDFDGYSPPHYLISGSKGAAITLWEKGYIDVTVASEKKAPTGVYVCPSENSNYSYDRDNIKSPEEYYSSYWGSHFGFNYYLTKHGNNQENRVTNVSYPSKHYCFCDYDGGAQAVQYQDVAPRNYSIKLRHFENFTNIAFSDGHSETVNYCDLVLSGPPLNFTATTVKEAWLGIR